MSSVNWLYASVEQKGSRVCRECSIGIACIDSTTGRNIQQQVVVATWDSAHLAYCRGIISRGTHAISQTCLEPNSGVGVARLFIDGTDAGAGHWSILQQAVTNAGRQN